MCPIQQDSCDNLAPVSAIIRDKQDPVPIKGRQGHEDIDFLLSLWRLITLENLWASIPENVSGKVLCHGWIAGYHQTLWFNAKQGKRPKKKNEVACLNKSRGCRKHSWKTERMLIFLANVIPNDKTPTSRTEN